MKRKWWVISGAVLAVAIATVLVRANGRLLWIVSELDPVTPILISPAGNLVITRESGIDEIDSRGSLVRVITDTDDPDIRPFCAAGNVGTFSHLPPASGARYGLVDWEGSVRWTFTDDMEPVGPIASSADGLLYLYGRGWILYVYRPDGTMAWKRTGNSASSSPPAVAPDGSVAVKGPAVLLLNADGSERWSRSPQLFGTTALFRDDQGNVYLAGPGLICLDPNGNERWQVENPSNIATRDSKPPAGSQGLHFTDLRVSPRGWVYSVSIDGVMHVFDQGGRHQWSFGKGSTVYGQDWIAFTGSGNALLCASEFKPLNVPGGPLTKLGFGGVETNRRLVCLSPMGQVVWEQSLPGELDWRIPRSRAELQESWQRRFGLRDSQALRGPVIGPDGTIYVMGFTARSLNRLYAIRGD